MANSQTSRKSYSRSAWEWTKSIVVALAIWFVLRALLIQAFRIPSPSMENTLLIGDFLFVNKALYGAEVPLVKTRLPAIREPRRFDVVVFDSPETPGTSVVKRVVGISGDTLQMDDNQLLLNGEPVEEPYAKMTEPVIDPEHPQMRAWQVKHLVGAVKERYRPTLKNWGPIVVPPDSFFVMGDNRDNSYDSRYWGFLGRDRIDGKPLVIYYSFDNNGSSPLPFLTSIRWGRLFSRPN